jgi:hypothetical protein
METSRMIFVFRINPDILVIITAGAPRMLPGLLLSRAPPMLVL